MVLFSDSFFIIAEFFTLRKQIKENRPDMIHAHWIITQGFIAALIKKIYGIPFVVTIHGGDIFKLQGKIPTSLKKFSLLNVDKITVVSNVIKKEALERIDSKLNIDVIPMDVDSKLFNPDKRDNSIRKKYGINGLFLLFVGKLIEKKELNTLLKQYQKL